jgi:hypothetical protein
MMALQQSNSTIFMTYEKRVQITCTGESPPDIFGVLFTLSLVHLEQRVEHQIAPERTRKALEPW